jgi:glycosyltransferase involved in cell wall biosynthesis
VRVTVAVATWNRAAVLDRALAQYRSLRVPAGVTWELVVVNNNCTDDTDTVVAKYTDLPVVLCHEPTPGKVHALNHAVAKSTGDVLLFTDDDALIEPDWLEKIVAGFDRFGADLVFGKVLPWWESKPPGWYSTVLDANFALLDFGPDPEVITDPGRAPFGVNYAFKRSVFDRIGTFRTDLGPRGKDGYGGEDDDIFRRLLAAGLKAVYLPDAVVRHYVPASRCEKRYHRRRAWKGSRDHLALLRHEAAAHPHLPRLAGVPRYVFRINLGYVGSFFKETVVGDRAKAFFYELKLIRLAGLVWALGRGAKP